MNEFFITHKTTLKKWAISDVFSDLYSKAQAYEELDIYHDFSCLHDQEDYLNHNQGRF